MFDPDLLAVATGAGGNIAASMITAAALAVRARIMELFRESTVEQTAAVNAYDNDARVLAEWANAAARSPELTPELTRARERLSGEWARRVLDYVRAHPDARPDLEALHGMVAGSTVGSQHNTGSGTFINGTVFGGVHNSHSEGLQK